MEYNRTTTSSKYSPEELCRAMLITPVKESCNFRKTRPETLVKHDLTKDAFLQLIFPKKVFLKNFLLLDGDYYSIKKPFVLLTVLEAMIHLYNPIYYSCLIAMNCSNVSHSLQFIKMHSKQLLKL